MQISLRGMMILVAIVATAIVSLTYANEEWLAIVAAITMLSFSVSLVVAAIDRGPRQAFAIGFALTVATYWIVVANGGRARGGGNVELDPYTGRLPTTFLLRHVHRAVEHGSYFDFATGKELPDYDPAKNPTLGSGGGGFSGGGLGGGGFGGGVSYREAPSREFFMPVGHCWWSILLGYAGGHFARFVHWRRVKATDK